MEDRKSIGGHPTSMFVDVPPANLICALCLLIFKNPHQCKNGHVYCLSCITEALESNRECPVCRTHLKVDSLASCLIVRDMIGQLQTKCSFVNCPWTGSLVSRDDHIKICNFESVLCPLYKQGACGRNCFGTVLREEKDSHVQKEIAKSSVKIAKQLLNKLEAKSSEVEMLREYMPFGKHRNNQGSATSFTGVWKSDEFCYCGTVVNNKLNGYCNAKTLNWTFCGNTIDHRRQGDGRLEFSDGDIYEGAFKDNARHGYGGYYCKEFNYEGEWKDDKMNGTGTMYWKDGSVYVGEFKNDWCNGQGKLTKANGECICGVFVDGEEPVGSTTTSSSLIVNNAAAPNITDA